MVGQESLKDTEIMNNFNKILNGLRNEINETLFWFVEMDLKMLGKVTQSTKDAFKAQGVKFPTVLETI